MIRSELFIQKDPTDILTFRADINGKDLALGVGCMGPVGALEVHFFRGELDLSSWAGARGPRLLPWLGLLSGGSSGGD